MIKICLDETLKKLNITRYELSKRTGIQYQIIDNYYKNKVKRYDCYVLERICIALNCDIGDIIKIDARMECDSKCVICFADGGIAFNPLFQKEPDTHLPLNRRKEGGLGIYMIKQLTSKVNYKYENGMNILTIEKQKTEA